MDVGKHEVAKMQRGGQDSTCPSPLETKRSALAPQVERDQRTTLSRDGKMGDNAFDWIPLKGLLALVIALLALFSCLSSARCEVSVKGTVAAARIDAQQAPLSEVLRALGTNFKVRYDTFIAIDGVIISGTYSGALEEVLRRMLSGLNYVIKTREGTVEVIIVGFPSNAPPAPPASHASPASSVWDPLGALTANSRLQAPPQTSEELKK